MKKFLLALPLIALASGCARVETGSIGVRRNFDKTVEMTELQPGTLNQTLVGEVMVFPVKDVQVDINDLTPLAADNSTIKDFDLSVIYSIDPNSAADIFTGKSTSFHRTLEDGTVQLMANYVAQLGRNAAYKVARNYPALKLADNRQQLETEVRQVILDELAQQHLGGIHISQVQVKHIAPADAIVQSANQLVQAENDRKRKEVEVGTAEAEARRIKALNANAGATKYMEASAIVNISEAIKEGKVHTIVVPYDFKGIVNVK